MSLNITSQVDLLTPKLHNLALGQLYAALDFVGKTTRWATKSIIENGSSFEIPILGDLTSNVRAPGGAVVDQTPVPDVKAIPVIERETSFRMDPTWLSSEGNFMFAEQKMMSAINALCEDVTTDILASIVASSTNTTGTLGAPLTKVTYDFLRKTLTENKLPKNNRFAIISTDMMEDTGNIPEYNDFDRSGVAGNHLSGVTGIAAGFSILETPYLPSPAAGQHQGFACDAQSVHTVFPMQQTFNRGENAIKTEAEKDGLRLYLLKEYVDGFNGMERWTLSVRFGAITGRNAGVITINGK